MDLGINLAVRKVLRTRLGKKIVTWGSYTKKCDTYNKSKKANSFIAEINNEKSEIKKQYRERFLGLKKLILFRFYNDRKMYYPEESVFFKFNCKGKYTYSDFYFQNDNSYKESFAYYEDKLGLLTMSKENKIAGIKTYGQFGHVESVYENRDHW